MSNHKENIKSISSSDISKYINSEKSYESIQNNIPRKNIKKILREGSCKSYDSVSNSSELKLQSESSKKSDKYKVSLDKLSLSLSSENISVMNMDELSVEIKNKNITYPKQSITKNNASHTSSVFRKEIHNDDNNSSSSMEDSSVVKGSNISEISAESKSKHYKNNNLFIKKRRTSEENSSKYSDKKESSKYSNKDKSSEQSNMTQSSDYSSKKLHKEELSENLNRTQSSDYSYRKLNNEEPSEHSSNYSYKKKTFNKREPSESSDYPRKKKNPIVVINYNKKNNNINNINKKDNHKSKLIDKKNKNNLTNSENIETVYSDDSSISTISSETYDCFKSHISSLTSGPCINKVKKQKNNNIKMIIPYSAQLGKNEYAHGASLSFGAIGGLKVSEELGWVCPFDGIIGNIVFSLRSSINLKGATVIQVYINRIPIPSLKLIFNNNKLTKNLNTSHKINSNDFISVRIFGDSIHEPLIVSGSIAII